MELLPIRSLAILIEWRVESNENKPWVCIGQVVLLGCGCPWWAVTLGSFPISCRVLSALWRWGLFRYCLQSVWGYYANCALHFRSSSRPDWDSIFASGRLSYLTPGRLFCLRDDPLPVARAPFPNPSLGWTTDWSLQQDCSSGAVDCAARSTMKETSQIDVNSENQSVENKCLYLDSRMFENVAMIPLSIGMSCFGLSLFGDERLESYLPIL